MNVPPGWRRVVLADIATSVRNGIFARRPQEVGGGVRILRISAVRDHRVSITDVKYVDGLSADQVDAFKIDAGDLLVTRYNGSRDYVGISGIVADHIGSILHPDKLIRIKLDPTTADARFVNYQFANSSTRQYLTPLIRTTAGQSGISGATLKSVPLALPPLAEQRRIVDILEDHLSRLDAARRFVETGLSRQRGLRASFLVNLLPSPENSPERWGRLTVGDVGLVDLGRQRHPDWHTGPNMRPYLRVANVFEADIRTDDVKSMHWSGDTFDRFRLTPGDVLLNEGQTPELVGRPAMYRGELGAVAFTNSLLRFRAGPLVLPEFALLVFRRHLHAGRFKREARITTNIAHLSASRLKQVEFPVPSLEEQRELVQRADDFTDATARLSRAIGAAERRGNAFRRALLAAAFTGRLTGRSTDTEIVEEFAAGSAA